VNPDERYQSASELRHDIEKIRLHSSWGPNIIQSGTEWTCSVGKMEFSAKSIRRSHGCFDFELYKGQTGKKKRIVNVDCGYCEKKSTHENRIKRVLTRIVITGR